MSNFQDDDLVELIKKGDTHAEALLCEKYWRFARIFGKKFAVLYYDLGVSADEFASVAFSSIVRSEERRVGKEC